MTKIYVAGTTFYDGGGNLIHGGSFDKPLASRINLLESFYYVKDWQTQNIKNFKSFMLDSGAYTFAYGSKATVDWDEYTEAYIRYVAENDVELFFELDIDVLVGYDKVKELRARIERAVGRQTIPVWHMNRGKEEWLRMCDEYDYVAIGDIVLPGNKRVMTQYLPWFTGEAHKRGAKVHGLGYTSLKNLARTGLDSVDSAAWLAGNMGGFIYLWDGTTMRKIDSTEEQRVRSKEVARHNFMEWVRMAEDLEEK